ncbi:MAG TPA: glutamyl-tRNA reductase [Armatimonadota bacterium]|nr:glutamyl-tRNA reductase [Armatimonadota bacterium]
MPIFCVGVNFRTTPVAYRERFHIGTAALPDMLKHFRSIQGVDETVILSTCNRTEVYVTCAYPTDVVNSFVELAGLPLQEIRTFLYQYNDLSAVEHLFRVSCGLDSLIIGETQILRQVRDALAVAQRYEVVDKQLTTLCQHAIATGKRARANTDISAGVLSIGQAGVELAKTVFPTLTEHPVLILGAGKISELTAQHLVAEGVTQILVANRTYQHACELAERLGGKAMRYEHLHSVLPNVDIIICSTSAPSVVLQTEDIAQVMADRHNRPLCLIDLAVPRNIAPGAGTLPDVHLFNIDDLQQVTLLYQRQRVAEIPRVETIIAEELERYRYWQAGQDVAEIIIELHKSFERVRQSELNRRINTLHDFTPKQRAEIDALTKSLVNKLLHTPTVRMKEILAHEPERSPQILLRDLFALSETIDEDHRP